MHVGAFCEGKFVLLEKFYGQFEDNFVATSFYYLGQVGS